MDAAELDVAERTMEVSYRFLLDRDPEQARIFQENCRRLIDIASGALKPTYRKILLVNGRPTRKSDSSPAA